MGKLRKKISRLTTFALAVVLLFVAAACGKDKAGDIKLNDDSTQNNEVQIPEVPNTSTGGVVTHPSDMGNNENQGQSTDTGTAGNVPTQPQPSQPVEINVPDVNQVTSPDVNNVNNIAGNYLSSAANLSESADMGQDYIDKIVFLGDSTTYGLRYYEMLNGGKETTQVWTPASGTLTLSYQSVATIVYPETDAEITIREAAAAKQPEYLVITLGVNGVSFMDESYFKSEYMDLVRGIQQASPNTKIILQSIFPVASEYQYLSSINNEKIAAANQWVLEVAEETGVKYLATASALVGEDGYLPHDYQNGDGLHLNPTSFDIVLNYIRTHGWQ